MNAQEPEVSISAQTNFTIVPNGFIGSDISDRAFRVYVTLRAFVRPGHSTFPKITTVGERFGMSESYIKRGISELREKGLLKVEKRLYFGGFRKVNSYFFPDISDLPEGGKFDPSERVTATDRPEVADLTLPIEEEKQEEEKLEEGPASPATLKRASQIKPEFRPTPQMLDWARKEAPLVDAVFDTQQFIDHHLAKGSLMKDWGRAWQTWMRNSQKWTAQKNPQAAGGFNPNDWMNR